MTEAVAPIGYTNDRLFGDDVYRRFDPFDGDRDVNIRCRKVSIVSVRKRQACMALDYASKHSIEPGASARFEKAIVDGEWGSYYTCIACMNKWLVEECHMEPNK